MSEIYVLVDDELEPIMGGGSSTKPSIKAYKTYREAKRGKSAFKANNTVGWRKPVHIACLYLEEAELV